MSSFKSLLMVAVVTVSLAACSGSDDDMGYLGSRDDIIINNAGSTQVAETAVKVETQTAAADIETAVEVGAQEAKADMETAVEVGAQEAKADMETAVEVGAQEAKADMQAAVVPETKTISKDGQPMETVTMGLETEKASSETSTISPSAGATSVPTGATGDVPPNARPGECYAKVLTPAITESTSERIQVSEEQKVLDRIIPAKYQTTTERVKVKEARQFWKAGKGPITKKDEVTGEILCLVEEPAEYKIIEKRVLVSPEKPEYKMVPARFETVTKQNIIKAESWEWRRILCETNLSSTAITQIQRALNMKGYNVAPDGKLGSATMDAINNYQLKNSLASRGITYETLDHMGVTLTGS